MAEATKIQWTDHTFNPWIGCSKVHAGCSNCYAEADMDKRRGRVQWGPNGTRSLTKTWSDPRKWNKQAKAEGVRRKLFCASLADWAEDWKGDMLDSDGKVVYEEEFNSTLADPHRLRMRHARNLLLRLAEQCEWLDWQFLTKRPDAAAKWLWEWRGPQNMHRELPRNWWFGTSVSDQATFDLLADGIEMQHRMAPFNTHFLSVEPMLGPLSIENIGHNVDWVIIGGESGPNARGMQIEWAARLIEECIEFDIAVFVKQLGKGWRLADKTPKGDDWGLFPEHLKIREFPDIKRAISSSECRRVISAKGMT